MGVEHGVRHAAEPAALVECLDDILVSVGVDWVAVVLEAVING
jgi:hypothetical protein